MPTEISTLERFVCATYPPTGANTLACLQWELFQSRNLEDELLPPTVGTLIPYVQKLHLHTEQILHYSLSDLAEPREQQVKTEGG